MSEDGQDWLYLWGIAGLAAWCALLGWIVYESSR